MLERGSSSVTREPDFEALRAERNARYQEMVNSLCEEHGWDLSKVFTSFDPDACYCDCNGGGPCEHNWGGWQEFDDGKGGEQVCQRCGMGAMSHSLSTGP